MSELSSIKVAVLMGTYNGAQYLVEQLDSIRKQGLSHIDVWVSDDGSSDNTIELLKFYQKVWDKGRFEIKAGPKQGFAANFLSLVCEPDIDADYYAYSDQDDIWQRDKLSRAISFIEQVDNDKPALYCSRTCLIDGDGTELNRFSPLFNKLPSFQNALVQSIAGGNTMVLNNLARQLLCSAGITDVVSHDWWTYMLVAGAGGEVVYDEIPSIQYRQHQGNRMGTNNNWHAGLYRLKLLLAGRFREWNSINVGALLLTRDLLTKKNQNTLEYFFTLRKASVVKRLWLLKKTGIYRQTLIGNAALLAAALFNKL